MGPILGGIKQYKQCNCMVNLRDFPLMEHCLRVGNKRTTFKTMLRKISDEHIGNHEASEVLDALKLTHTDIRVSALCNIIMPDILPELYSLSESVNGMVETSDFTFEYALQQAFMKDNGTIPWNLLKRALEDEITRRDNDGIDEDL